MSADDTQSSVSRQHYIDTGEYLPGCPVTLTAGRRARELPKCGQPIHADGLCKRHHADKVRLSKPRNHRLVRLADLTDRHIGRNIEVAGHVGILTDTIPCGDRVQLALIVGGARIWTDALGADETAEVWTEVAG